MDDVKREYLTWLDVRVYCDTVMSNLAEAGIHVPDVIVPITRGGLIPGTMIAHTLGVTDVRPICIQTRDGNKTTDTTWAEICALHGKTILVVDEILDSGKTIEAILESTPIESISNIHFAFLIANQEADVFETIPGAYYARAINRSTDTDWFVFPWEE